MRFDRSISKLRDSDQAIAHYRLAIIVLAICLVFLPLCAGAQAGMPGSQKEELTVIRAGTLIDGKGGPPRANQVIVVRGYRIERVQDAAVGEIPTEAKLIDLSKATVLPGLIDVHTHIFLQGEDPAQGGYDVQLLKYGLAFRAARAAVAARRALEQGFTAIRDVETEGAGYGDVGIKQAIEQGYIPGPRVFASKIGRAHV